MKFPFKSLAIVLLGLADKSFALKFAFGILTICALQKVEKINNMKIIFDFIVCCVTFMFFGFFVYKVCQRFLASECCFLMKAILNLSIVNVIDYGDSTK